MVGRLDARVAVITGAGSGIGRASALRFAEEGAALVLNDIQPQGLEDTLKTVVAAGGRVHGLPGDVTPREVNDALATAAVEQFGGLDIFFCNAGGARPTPMLETSDDEYRHQIALNLDSVWLGATSALKVMTRQERGVILATTSGAGLGAVDGLPAYGAAKAGVINLMRSVAFEFGALGIRANAIAPGPMATPGLLAWLDTLPGGPEAYGAQVPLGRLGTGEEIAEAAVFLASDESRYVSGAVLPVDGAIHSTLATPKS